MLPWQRYIRQHNYQKTKFALLTCLLLFLTTEGSRVLEKKVNETQVSKTVFSHLKTGVASGLIGVEPTSNRRERQYRVEPGERHVSRPKATRGSCSIYGPIPQPTKTASYTIYFQLWSLFTSTFPFLQSRCFSSLSWDCVCFLSFGPSASTLQHPSI